MPKRLIAYIRVSRVGDRDEESDSFQTVDQQREAIESIAKLSDAEIVDEVKALNASGGKNWPEPKLKAAIARVDHGEADGIAVYDLSRWGRSLDALKVIERWTAEGKTMVSAADKFDASEPSGVMCLTMMMAVARYYWQTAKVRFFESQKDAIEERDLWVGRVPFGYLRPEVKKKANGKPEYGPLEIDETAAPIVTKAYEIASRDGFRATTLFLQREVPGKPWRAEVVRTLLSSHAYLGTAFLGKLKKENAHPALVTPELHVEVQRLPEMTAAPRRASGDYPLSGIARCGTCGGGMIGQLHCGPDGVRRRRLLCGCGGGASIRAEKLEDYVRDRMGVVLCARATWLRDERDAPAEAETGLGIARDDLRKWLGDDRAREMVGDDLWYAGVAERTAKLEVAKEIYQREAGREHRAELIHALTDLRDPEQFERAAKAMLKAVRIRPGRGEISERVLKIEWTEGVDTAMLQHRNPFTSNASESTAEAGMAALASGHR